MKPRPFMFFALLFVLSLPFWVYGTVAGVELLPGLPVSSIMVICPLLAGGLLVLRDGGRTALTKFLIAAFDWRGIKLQVWLVALATMPVVMIVSALVLSLAGEELPPPQISLGQTLGLLALFFVSATAEELGWTGYATRPLVTNYGLVIAALIIGTASVIWHVIPLLQVGRSWDWILWWAIGTMARRIIIVWLYVQGGQRVISASVFHAMSNLSWMLFPVMGSHYDPVTVAVLLVIFTTFLISRSGNTRHFV